VWINSNHGPTKGAHKYQIEKHGGPIPPPPSSQLAQAEIRIAELEAELAPPPAHVPTPLEQALARIAELEAQLLARGKKGH